MILKDLKGSGWVFCIMYLYWDFSVVFFIIRLGLWVVVKRTPEQIKEEPFSYHNINMTYHYWHESLSPDWGSVCKVLHYKVTLFSPFPTVLFGKQSLYTAHTYRIRYYAPPSWGGSTYVNYLNSAEEICLLSILLFFYWF